MDDDTIAEIFREAGPLVIRRMFGGRGIYRDGVMFALESGGVLYLKADAEGAETLKASGSHPFSYPGRNGVRVSLGYFSLPEDALDDPEEAKRLADRAVLVAERARQAKPANSAKEAHQRPSQS